MIKIITDSTSYRHWCLKRCPQCNTYYHWDFTYDYYVNGTEDEITFTRLEDKDVQMWMEKVEVILNKKRKKKQKRKKM